MHVVYRKNDHPGLIRVIVLVYFKTLILMTLAPSRQVYGFLYSVAFAASTISLTQVSYPSMPLSRERW